MNIKHLILPGVAVALGAYLSMPEDAAAYSLIGGSLGQGQRDFRIFNNFADAQTNNNTTPDSQFPGYFGAEMAIWKASVEWGSELHGNGNGDPHQPGGLGSGGANFDTSFQGNATGIGGTDDNIHSALGGSSGGVLAYTETPISNGWRIRYYEGWSWADGPGTSVSGVDLQGVACHEYGHALGLGHTNSGGATMYPSISGTGVSQRSIATDDINGIKAVYGAKSGTKPHISGISVNGSTITVNGNNFDGSGNQIWFTQKGQGGNGTPVKAINLSSNGTSVSASIPANAGPGDVLVRRNSTANSGLSNAFPWDGVSGGGGTGGAPNVTSVSPAAIPALTVDGPLVVTLSGSGFTGTTQVKVDGVVLTVLPPSYAIVNDSTLTFNMPLVSALGSIPVEITNSIGSTTTNINVVANATPAVELSGSDPQFLLQGAGAQVTVASRVGDFFFLAASDSNLPTPLPGIANFAIGNNYTQLYLLATPAVGPKGWVQFNFPMSGFPTGFKLHFQAAVLEALKLYALPATMTNVQTGTILF